MDHATAGTDNEDVWQTLPNRAGDLGEAAVEMLTAFWESKPAEPPAAASADPGGSRAILTVNVDAGLLAKARSAMKSAAEVTDAEVIERVLRSYPSRRALDASQALSKLSEADTKQIANEELHAMRRERRNAA